MRAQLHFPRIRIPKRGRAAEGRRVQLGDVHPIVAGKGDCYSEQWEKNVDRSLYEKADAVGRVDEGGDIIMGGVDADGAGGDPGTTSSALSCSVSSRRGMCLSARDGGCSYFWLSCSISSRRGMFGNR